MADGQPKTLAEAKRMIARLREQNHAHAAKRDQELRLLNRQVAKTRADFERARSLVRDDDFYDHFWKHASFSAKYRLVDLLREARKINVEQLAKAMHEGMLHNARGGVDDELDKRACIQFGWEKSHCRHKAQGVAAEYERLS